MSGKMGGEREKKERISDTKKKTDTGADCTLEEMCEIMRLKEGFRPSNCQ
jgi:hypothetical protein